MHGGSRVLSSRGIPCLSRHSCWASSCGAMRSWRGSSRWRPIEGPRTLPRTRSGARPRGTRRCSGRRGTCTCTSPTGCTTARTSCAGRKASRGRSFCALWRRSAGWRRWPSRRYGTPEPALGQESDVEPGAAPRRARRPWRPEELCSGPAKLCQAFALDRRADGYDLVSGHDGVVLLDDGTQPPGKPATGTRVGLSKRCAARDEPWRWWVPGEPNVSGRRSSH